MSYHYNNSHVAAPQRTTNGLTIAGIIIALVGAGLAIGAHFFNVIFATVDGESMSESMWSIISERQIVWVILPLACAGLIILVGLIALAMNSRPGGRLAMTGMMVVFSLALAALIALTLFVIEFGTSDFGDMTIAESANMLKDSMEQFREVEGKAGWGIAFWLLWAGAGVALIGSVMAMAGAGSEKRRTAWTPHQFVR